jgi:channel protein (hemolysin III family)
MCAIRNRAGHAASARCRASVGVRGLDLHGVRVVLSAPSARARLAAAIYAVSVAALFASSALYHRVRWRSPAARRWMRRWDDSMIFVVIAGTFTPFARSRCAARSPARF